MYNLQEILLPLSSGDYLIASTWNSLGHSRCSLAKWYKLEAKS